MNTDFVHARKVNSRKVWSQLTPFMRNWLRAEYRHLVRCGTSSAIVHSTIDRTAHMFLCARVGL